MAITTDALKKIPYFSNLDAEIIEKIKRVMFEKKVSRGEMILFEDEPAKALFFVASGAVKIFKTSTEGKEQILNIVRPGESFNDISIFDDGLNPAGAQAMGPVELYGISKEEMDDILRQHPQMALTVIKTMAQRVRQLVSLVEDLSFRRVLSRVARILLEYASDKTEPKTRLTQQDIAAMAGTAREVVGRSLKNLEENGTIRMESHRVIITDHEALKQLAVQMSETF
jgi:CRP/FNR family transcriptional regulator